MPAEHDWAEFESLMSGEARIHISRLRAKSDQDVKDALANHIFGSKSRTKTKFSPTKDETHFRRVFSGFTEINSCVERLRDIQVYVGSFPYRSQKLSRVRFLRYQIESYFHEVYILKERLIAYLTTIGRLFRRDLRHSDILQVTRPMFSDVSLTLKDISKTLMSTVPQISGSISVTS